MRRQNDALDWEKANDAYIPRRSLYSRKGQRQCQSSLLAAQSLLKESDARRWEPATQESDACR